MRVAALDLGSNTFLLLIAEVESNQIKKVLLDETRVVRLGQGVHKERKFSVEALKRAQLCLAEFSGLIKKFQCEKVVAVATSAARDVENGEDFLSMGQSFGIPIHIISGDMEAQITFKGATGDWPQLKQPAVIDVGGGSTEVIGRLEGKEISGASLDVGSVRLTELFLPKHPCAEAELSQLQSYIKEKWREQENILSKISSNEVIAVAGTPTTLVCLEEKRDFAENFVHGYELKVKDIWRWRDLMASMSIEQRQALPGMQASRADVLVAGATILATIAELLGAKHLKVSTKGVRYGVAQLWEKLL